ncbi:MAG: hypothetical protein D6754_07835, partial [Alphaproteobacteria bacterium]
NHCTCARIIAWPYGAFAFRSAERAPRLPGDHLPGPCGPDRPRHPPDTITPLTARSRAAVSDQGGWYFSLGDRRAKRMFELVYDMFCNPKAKSDR